MKSWDVLLGDVGGCWKHKRSEVTSGSLLSRGAKVLSGGSRMPQTIEIESEMWERHLLISSLAAHNFEISHFKKRVWGRRCLLKTNEAFSGWCQMERDAEIHLFGSSAGQHQPGTKRWFQSQSAWPTCQKGLSKLPPTLRRTNWHLPHRISLQNIESIPSVDSRPNKLPSKCSSGFQKWQCVWGGGISFVVLCLYVIFRWGRQERAEDD